MSRAVRGAVLEIANIQQSCGGSLDAEMTSLYRRRNCRTARLPRQFVGSAVIKLDDDRLQSDQAAKAGWRHNGQSRFQNKIGCHPLPPAGKSQPA